MKFGRNLLLAKFGSEMVKVASYDQTFTGLRYVFLWGRKEVVKPKECQLGRLRGRPVNSPAVNSITVPQH